MKKLVPVLGATLMILAIAAIYLWQELQTQREQNEETMAWLTSLESGNPESRDAPFAEDGTLAAATATVPGAQSGVAPAVPASREQSAGRGAGSFAALAEQLFNNPESQEFSRIMMRQMLEEEFPDVERDLNLGKDRTEKLLDLLARQRSELAAVALSQLQGGAPDRAAMAEAARLEEQKERAFELELKALLGDTYPKWREYEQAAMDRQRQEYTRMGQERMRDAISAGGAPLTDAQFKYLTSALETEQKRIDQEMTSPQQQMQRLPESNRRLLTVAAQHLNPQQLEGYRKYLQQQQEMISTMDNMGAFFSD